MDRTVNIRMEILYRSSAEMIRNYAVSWANWCCKGMGSTKNTMKLWDWKLRTKRSCSKIIWNGKWN